MSQEISYETKTQTNIRSKGTLSHAANVHGLKKMKKTQYQQQEIETVGNDSRVTC